MRDAAIALTITLLVAAIAAGLLFIGESGAGWALMLVGLWLLVGLIAWTFGDGRFS
jgi:hypothetical protein